MWSKKNNYLNVKFEKINQTFSSKKNSEIHLKFLVLLLLSYEKSFIEYFFEVESISLMFGFIGHTKKQQIQFYLLRKPNVRHKSFRVIQKWRHAYFESTVKPVYNGQPRNPKFEAVADRWSLFRGRFMI